MADVNISKFRASVVRDGSKPASPGFVVSEGQDPVNPPGTNNYVPYSGATANVELGEYGVEAGFITLDTTPTNTPTDQGTIFWDVDDETVDIVLNGYTMKIGEDLFYPVKNQTGSTIAKGTAVRFNGTVGASGRLLIAPFIADGSVPSTRFMGVTAEEILNGEDGKVLNFGRVRGINTDAFNEGDILYASTTVAGGFQTAIPVSPNNIVQVAAVVTKSATIGTIFVRPTLASNLNTDEAVKLTSVADKDLLQYQSGTALWENKTLAQVLGGTSSQFVKGDGSLDSTSYGTGTVTSVGLSSATSGVTIGSTPVTTSGTITLAIATASGSQNGLLSSTDWTTFNNKQNALTNPVTGTGTTNYLPKFTGSTTIGNSNLINDASGNLGLGVTPSAWSLGKAIEIGNIGNSVWGVNTTQFNVLQNVYYDGGGFKYATTNAASYYQQASGAHAWYNAPSMGAGTAITFTQAMTLFATGNLLVGTPSPISDNGARLQVSGQIRANNVNLYVASAARGGLYTFNQVLGSGTDYSVGIFSEGEIFLAPGGNTTKRFSMTNAGAATFSGDVIINSLNPIAYCNATSNNRASGIITQESGTSKWAFGTNFGSGDNSWNVYNYGAGSRYLTITSGGNVLIGTTTSGGYKCEIQTSSTNAALWVQTGGTTSSYVIADFRTGTNLPALQVLGNGTIIMSALGTGTVTSTSGTLSTTSDMNLKIEDGFIDSAIDKILSLKPRYFYWNEKSGLPTNIRQLGFYAQEVNQSLGEEAANTPKNKNIPWGISDRSMIAMLTKAIQEQQEIINDLKQKIA